MMDGATPPRLALSIKQPWAELIVTGKKTIEVRSWSTPYRGPFWVHVGKRPDDSALLLFPFPYPLFYGGFIGMARINAVGPFTRARWSQLRCHHLVQGPMPEGTFGWEIGDPIRLSKAVLAPGRLGLFEVPEALTDVLQAGLAK